MMDDTLRSCANCGHGVDGPIDPGTAGIGRRTFLVQTGLLAATALLAACGAGGDSATAPTLSGPATIKLSDYPSLASVGGIAMVTIASSPFAVVRTGSTTFVALSRVCPHQQSIVNQNGSGFLCPNHGARFDATGHWTGGQPTGNLQSYVTTYDAAAGTVTVG
jgi:nitrite reductase/ring-hydroxylating ferredoxin subunit